jgi:hypothetical protein
LWNVSSPVAVLCSEPRKWWTNRLQKDGDSTAFLDLQLAPPHAKPFSPCLVASGGSDLQNPATRREMVSDTFGRDLLPEGYPVGEETASVAEDVLGETSSEGTSRI